MPGIAASKLQRGQEETRHTHNYVYIGNVPRIGGEPAKIVFP